MPQLLIKKINKITAVLFLITVLTPLTAGAATSSPLGIAASQAATSAIESGVNELGHAMTAEPVDTVYTPVDAYNKAERLADEFEQQIRIKADILGDSKVPSELESLQRIAELSADGGSIIDDDITNIGASIDIRKDSQKDAALSYGARGGLAKRNYQIMEKMKSFDKVLDNVFNFRTLLIKAPSGLLIEPPIVKESLDAVVIESDGNEAAVAESVFDINKRARIVTAPRDWRHYLIQTWSEVPPPPRVLWPKNDDEQKDWNYWIEKGWEAGVEQAEEIFELNTNRLSADYAGMVRYRVLLAQGMISAPYAIHEERGVTGEANQMRVGDSALKITGHSQFLTGAELWNPADR